MYRIIEHFALGRRRLELFGEDHNIRTGWLTVGKELSSSNFNAEVQYLVCQLHVTNVAIFFEETCQFVISFLICLVSLALV